MDTETWKKSLDVWYNLDPQDSKCGYIDHSLHLAEGLIKDLDDANTSVLHRIYNLSIFLEFALFVFAVIFIFSITPAFSLSFLAKAVLGISSIFSSTLLYYLNSGAKTSIWKTANIEPMTFLSEEKLQYNLKDVKISYLQTNQNVIDWHYEINKRLSKKLDRAAIFLRVGVCTLCISFALLSFVGGF